MIVLVYYSYYLLLLLPAHAPEPLFVMLAVLPGYNLLTDYTQTTACELEIDSNKYRYHNSSYVIQLECY